MTGWDGPFANWGGSGTPGPPYLNPPILTQVPANPTIVPSSTGILPITFAWVGNGAYTQFQYRLSTDGVPAAWTTVSAATITETLNCPPQHSYMFEVQQGNGSGSWSASAMYLFSVIIQAVLPDSPVITASTPANGGWTTSTSFIVSFTVPAGDTCIVTLDGVPQGTVTSPYAGVVG